MTVSSTADPSLLQRVLDVTGLAAGNYREEALREGAYSEAEHPRGRGGRWMTKMFREAEGGHPAIPAEPGSTPIPPEYVRLYHRSSAPADVLRREGLRMDKAAGEKYGEPNVIWASASPKHAEQTLDNGYPAVEFAMRYDDPRWDIGKFTPGVNYDYPNPKSEHPERSYVERLYSHGSHVTFVGDIKPEDIIAVHEPWESHYRYMMENYPDSTTAKEDEFDFLLKDEDPTWGKALREWKRSVFGTPLAEAAYEERLHPRGRGGRWVNILGKIRGASL